MTTNYAIQTFQLSKQFGKRQVVSKLNLAVPKGEIYGFLGPNGAGKTTTIKMLLGLSKPTQGHILLLGKDMKKQRNEILKKVGSLVEYPTYYGHLSGYENLKVITQVLGLNPKRIDEVLRLVRLSKDAHRLAKSYSLGMKQRLGIAASLIAEPELLILDEPTNGLDPAGIQEIRELITQLPKQTGATLFISSHLLFEIEQVATHVGIISQGKLIYQDTLQTLKQQTTSSQVEFVVSSPEKAFNLIKSMGLPATLDQGIITLYQLDQENTAYLIQNLVQHYFSIYEVKRKESSLEDIFIQLTGKGKSL
ncbi:ABC transporter ATP-binding protein [Thermoflavimicrobium daqui]|uniref:Bacitracin ABC transporter ATP-binding protein n=1 Tax=Thermoflavimicrobium daqui TaxID=2137476 RepID=A0A364K4W1_9BACL|nr:ABC transporter ATP-binding protein [Thermoflavimicrobium daqui]RAL24405.1 bacitracin ABC transporter ATP-binding protein [Thermoflavimicrobium daqui]